MQGRKEALQGGGGPFSGRMLVTVASELLGASSVKL